MQRLRLNVWRHQDGQAKAIAVLAQGLEASIEFLVNHGTTSTAAEDFRTAVTREELDAALPVLLGLFAVDPRGGCFRLQNLKEALLVALREKGLLAKFHSVNKHLYCEVGDVAALAAYKLRILCAAARGKCSASYLKELFEVMKKSAHGSSVTAELEKNIVGLRSDRAHS